MCWLGRDSQTMKQYENQTPYQVARIKSGLNSFSPSVLNFFSNNKNLDYYLVPGNLLHALLYIFSVRYLVFRENDTPWG
jgi:hypothetical protein